MNLHRIWLGACLACWSGGALSNEKPGFVDSSEFVQIEPKSPEEERKHLHIKPGFRLELVASEPLVEDPVAMCFDESGALFVAELHHHQEIPDPKLSKIKLLRDSDGDGVYDTAETFADQLGWITAIAPWDGGIFIGASPDIIFLKDTDNDGKADLKQVVFSGFDETADRKRMASYHHERSLNNFNWGPGNRFFCAAGLNGGHVRNLAHPDQAVMNLRKLDFSFDPRTLLFRPETGSAQHGMAIDDWGNRFQTRNSDPALFPVFDHRYRLRNPGALFPPAMASIAQPNSKGPVFRRSRTEPWREARTRLRAAGLERGPIEQGGTVSGYFTGTADSTIYRSKIFPEEYWGSLFVGEVSENVVHRRVIHFPENRVEPVALRPDSEPDFEFIASSDNWFRPVQIKNGPGGALYICDMYREVVEAWHTIPADIRKHLDPNRGKDFGRIWRVVPDKFAYTQNSQELATTTADLVAYLESPHGWERDTAARLLYGRQDAAAIPLLEKKLDEAQDNSKLVILYALSGLDALQINHILNCLTSPEPQLRIHCIRLLEEFHLSGKTIPVAQLARLTRDPDPRVLFQLAFSLGSFPVEDAAPLLKQIAMRLPEDEWLARAVSSSAGDHGISRLWNDLLSEGLRSEAAVIAATREAGRLQLAFPGSFPSLDKSPDNWVELLQSYALGLKSIRSSLTKIAGKDYANKLQKRCREILLDKASTPKTKISCLELLPFTGIAEPDLLALLFPLLEPGEQSSLQEAALEAFRNGARSAEAATGLLEFLPRADLLLRPALISLLTRRESWQKQLLESVGKNDLKAMEISPADAAFLRSRPNPEISKRAAKLLPVPMDRTKVVAKFQKALAISGDTKSGEMIFRTRCLVCHRLGEEGGMVGPAMGEFQKHGKGQILLNALNPNKTIQPDYIGFLVETRSGESILGRVLEDNATAVTIRDVTGKDHIVSRDNIKELTSTGRSLMPEGLEAGLTNQQMADLLEFVVRNKL